MNRAVESFLARPLSHKIAAAVCSLVLLTGLFWQFFYKAQWEELEQLQERGINLESQVMKHRRIARELPRFREEAGQLNERLNMVLLELPDKGEIHQLLSSISALAVDTGMSVIRFAPQPEVRRDFFAELPVLLELEGTFHQFVSFADEVGRLARIVNIRDISLDILTERDNEVIVRVRCTVLSYRYLDESEQLQAAEEAKPATGGRRRQRAT